MSGGRDWQPAGNPWVVAIVVTLAVFMEIPDTTIVNVALPHIAGTVSASYDESTWVLTSYLVAKGIVLPISAFFGRVFVRKQYLLLCLGMFTICLFLCGIATELWPLILFRVLPGFFGGGLQPVRQSVLLDYFKPADRGKAFGISSIAIIVAPVLGIVGAVYWLLYAKSLVANVRLAGVEQANDALAYRQTVLTALQYMENALMSYRSDQQRVEGLQQTTVSLQNAFNLASENYLQDLSTFINVLDAQRQLALGSQQTEAARPRAP